MGSGLLVVEGMGLLRCILDRVSGVLFLFSSTEVWAMGTFFSFLFFSRFFCDANCCATCFAFSL